MLWLRARRRESSKKGTARKPGLCMPIVWMIAVYEIVKSSRQFSLPVHVLVVKSYWSNEFQKGWVVTPQPELRHFNVSGCSVMRSHCHRRSDACWKADCLCCRCLLG